MWMRLIGGGLLLACGVLWADGRGRAERGEITRVAGFSELFARVGEQIGALCLPLDEILCALPPSLSAVCGLSGADLAGAVAGSGIRDAASREVLDRTVAALGRGSRDDQVRLCRAATAALSDCRERMAKQAARDGRARLTLVMTGCLCGILLLW